MFIGKNVWLRGRATNCTGSSVGRQRERENAGVADGGARCSTTLAGVRIPAIVTTTRAISAAEAVAVQTHATGSASTLATCSWSTSTCPRGLEREHVHYHGHDYTLRGSETRTLTTVGAFRAVPASDLGDSFDQPLDPRHGELWNLRDPGAGSDGPPRPRPHRRHADQRGRDLLESRRLDDDSRDRQAFYAGIPKPRELKHDAEFYRAYTDEAERLRDEGANIHRIVLENDLKREYQEFLQERNNTTFPATIGATSSSLTFASSTTSMDAITRSTSRS
jgi:hypothetical protein